MIDDFNEIRRMRDDLARTIEERNRIAEALGLDIDTGKDDEVLAVVDQRLEQLRNEPLPIPEMWLLIKADDHHIARWDFIPDDIETARRAAQAVGGIALIHVQPSGAVTLERL